jgi:hypothetical protein
MTAFKERLRSQDVGDEIGKGKNDIESCEHQQESNMFGDWMLQKLLETAANSCKWNKGSVNKYMLKLGGGLCPNWEARDLTV